MSDQVNLLVPLVSLAVGALLGGVSQALVDRYAMFKETKGMAKALCAEMTAILQVVQHREYFQHLQQIIARLEDPGHDVTHEDVFQIRISQDYFKVFDSLCPKIGCLQELSDRIVSTYTLGRSLIEDFLQLNEAGEAVLEQRRNINKEGLREYTIAVGDLLQLVQQEAEQTVRQLRDYDSRRWLHIFP